MGLSKVTYNGFEFPDRSNFSVGESYVYDDSGRTVKATRFTLRVKSILVGDGGSTTESDFFAGPEVHTARQALSKAGGSLKIEHDGFTPRPHWVIGPDTASIKDSSWGPKPKLLQWDPIGHTNAIEVTWECEFEIPVCDGSGSPAFTGVSQFNYSVSFSMDNRGFTTRRINGVLEIAVTRSAASPRAVIDSADNYRHLVEFPKPHNFERTSDWQVSTDAKFATFSIVDSEIRSPNAWPVGVTNIQATHRVSRNIAALARIANTISATIELAPDQHKSRAWLIFSSIVQQRSAFASTYVFFESIDVVEELFDNRVSFQLSYRLLSKVDMVAFFGETGLFQPLNWSTGDQWQEWSDSMSALTPFDGTNTNRARAGLRHEFETDKIVDLCDNDPGDVPEKPESPTAHGYTAPPSLCNETPPAPYSWLVYDLAIKYDEDSPAHIAVQLKPQDLDHKVFDPNNPTANFPDVTAGVTRFIEERAGYQTITLYGYAERAGYPIVKPGKITIGGRLLRPIGKGKFMSKFLGTYLCVKKFGAAWVQKYVIDEPMTDVDPADNDIDEELEVSGP